MHREARRLELGPEHRAGRGGLATALLREALLGHTGDAGGERRAVDVRVVVSLDGRTNAAAPSVEPEPEAPSSGGDLAATFSVLNKVCDVVPELLIGVAIDVVVAATILSSVFGVSDRFDQLVVLAVLNVGAWLLESLTDYLAHVLWRGLAQAIQHDFRLAAYRHVQQLEVAWFEDTTSGGLLAVLNDDVNQLERFLDHGPDDILRRSGTSSSSVACSSDVAAAVGARVPADPADRRRFDPLPAPPRTALRRGARRGGRSPRSVGQPRRDHHDQGVHRRGARGGPAEVRRPTSTPTARRSATRRRSSR